MQYYLGVYECEITTNGLHGELVVGNGIPQPIVAENPVQYAAAHAELVQAISAYGPQHGLMVVMLPYTNGVQKVIQLTQAVFRGMQLIMAVQPGTQFKVWPK